MERVEGIRVKREGGLLEERESGVSELEEGSVVLEREEGSGYPIAEELGDVLFGLRNEN